MKKKLILTVLVLATVGPAWPQTRTVQLLEGEIGAGVVMPSVAPFSRGGYPGWQLVGELRFNLNTKFDVGLQQSFSRFITYNNKERDNERNITSIISFLFHRNWQPWNNVKLFAGAGVGYTMPLDGRLTDDIGADWYHYFTVYPSIGMELFDQLRLTAEYKITMTRFGYLGVGIGYVFGGRQRKAR